MKYSITSAAAVTLGLIPMITSATSPIKAQAQKPNIIFLLMDDLGYGELGCQGQTKIETPNIDALAKAGKTFTQHYSGSPVSAPSRCVLMTGLHSGHSVIRGNDEQDARGDVWSHEAVLANPGLEGQRPMPASTITLAQQLKSAGYTTACIGKWGLGSPGSVSEPNAMGFDFFYGYNCQRQSHTYYPTHLYKNRERVLLNNKVKQPNTKLPADADPMDARNYDQYQQNDYAPDLMFAETLNFIGENKAKPFFLWWTTPMPHASLQAPQNLIDYYVKKFGDEKPFVGDLYFPARYPHATYAAMVTYIDTQVGAIVEKLKSDGIYDNTIIVFTSDNGPTFNGGTDSPWFDSARPYKSERGWGKCSVHEGGINVPTIVAWNGKVAPNTKSDHLSAFQDWMPTLLEISGAPVAKKTDGISMVPTILDKGKQATHDALYWEYPESGGSIAVRQGPWKLIVKNIHKAPDYYLFNLSNDKREQNNLASANPEKVNQLKAIAAKSHTKSDNPAFQMPLPLK